MKAIMKTLMKNKNKSNSNSKSNNKYKYTYTYNNNKKTNNNKNTNNNKKTNTNTKNNNNIKNCYYYLQVIVIVISHYIFSINELYVGVSSFKFKLSK